MVFSDYDNEVPTRRIYPYRGRNVERFILECGLTERRDLTGPGSVAQAYRDQTLSRRGPSQVS